MRRRVGRAAAAIHSRASGGRRGAAPAAPPLGPPSPSERPRPLARARLGGRHFDDADAPQVQPNARVELAYRLDVNQYNGLEKVQLVVEFLRVL